MLKYCTACVMLETKPDLSFNDQGVCSAWQSFTNAKVADWESRRRDLERILDRYRAKHPERWDSIIPVNGGKDRTPQVLRMLQLGANPLCVTATTCDVSAIGRRNIENI